MKTGGLHFVNLLSGRYGASPALRMIAAAGPTSVSEEMTLPQSRRAPRLGLARVRRDPPPRHAANKF
jgi:hypothetical protein